MSLDAIRDKIISYVQDYSRKKGKPPTIKSICDNLEGVNRSNFYKIFPGGIGEVCTVADIEVPEKRIESTAKAVRSRTSQKQKLPQIQLNEETSAKIQTISYIENMTPQEILDELVENDRKLRKEYGLNIRDISRLASFLRNCEKYNVNKKRIIDSLIEFVNLRFDLLPVQNYNLLIKLWKDMSSNNWSFDHITWLYSQKQAAYQKGYSDCIERVTPTIVEEMRKNYEFGSISRNDAFRLGTSVSASLAIAGMRSGLIQ